MTTVRDIYEKLYRCYAQNGRSNIDKAKSFRCIIEDFVRSQGESVGPYAKLSWSLKKLFARKGSSSSLSEQCRSMQLLDELNQTTHRETPVSDADLRNLYQELARMIEFLTGIAADSKTSSVLAPTTLWYLRGLTQEQTAAVVDSANIIVVNAGPGTGKTHLLVHKMFAYLHASPSSHVVSLSFTNAAADHLRNRFLTLKMSAPGADAAAFPNVTTSTIHSYCFGLLNEFHKQFGMPFDYEILDDSDLDAVAREIADQAGNAECFADVYVALQGQETSAEIKALIRKYKEQHKFISVNEILDLFLEISKDSRFGPWVAKRLDCLLVDESQDLSERVYRIISYFMKARPGLKLFFVGDPRQNIFAFNGGAYENLMRFMRSIPSHAEHNLTVTYRCPKAVIDIVNPLRFIDCPNAALVQAEGASGQQGTRSLDECSSCSEEASLIVDLIKRCGDYTQTAVLCSNLKYLEPTASALNLYGIPFEVHGGQRVLRKPQKFINNCLKYAVKPQNEILRRIKRLVPQGQSDIEAALAKLADEHRLKQGKDVPLKGWIEALAPHWPEEDPTIQEYANVAAEYSSVAEFLFDSVARKNDEFSVFYEKTFSVDCETECAKGEGVVLSTIHSAKGLEWNNVIVAGMSDGILPSFRSFLGELSPAQLDKNINDEKKKFYVAVTRSRENLFLTYSNTMVSRYGKNYSCKLSRFVDQRLYGPSGWDGA